MYDRLNLLIGKENVEKLNKANILLAGVGGVGSFCFETLIRSGVQNITIIDFDTYEESNLNRQLHSNRLNIGKNKVDELKKYAKNINEDIKVNTMAIKLDQSANLDFKKYDYIIDAVDSLEAKIYIITKACEENIKVISSMGIAGRMNPEQIMVSSLDKTYNDPLAKKLRSSLNKMGFNKKIKVVFSKELPIKSKDNLPSYIAVTAYAGIMLADAVIKDLIK